MNPKDLGITAGGGDAAKPAFAIIAIFYVLKGPVAHLFLSK